MRVITRIPFILLTCLFLLSCKKDKVKEPSPDIKNDTSGDINAFFNKYAAPAQVFSISTASATTLVCSGGTTVELPALPFIVGGSTIQVQGTAEIKVWELMSKKDIIMNRQQTMTKDDILLSRGMIQITANQGGEEIFLGAGKTVTLNFPTPVTPGSDQFMFTGKVDLTSGNQFWIPDTAGNYNYASPVITPLSYKLVSDTLHWINLGKFNFSAGSKSSFTITVHGNYNKNNTEVFFYFPTSRSIAYLNKQNDQLYSSSYKIPVGTNFTIIAIAKINGNFYSSFTSATMSAGYYKDLDLTPTSETDFINALNAL